MRESLDLAARVDHHCGHGSYVGNVLYPGGFGDTVPEGIADGAVEHGSGGCIANEPFDRGTDRFEGCSVFADDEAGLGAELADSKGERSEDAFRNSFCISGGAGEKKDGVDTAHLGVDGYGLRPASSGVVECAPGAFGAGEADGAEVGMVTRSMLTRGAAPCTSEKIPAGRLEAATAFVIAAATISDVPGGRGAL